jgi:predicted transposase/invertase (TIGR01784 family)
MSKKLFPLVNDLIFKAVFGTEEETLLPLLNSFPCFKAEKQIQSISILNPEIPKNASKDKIVILDILAKDRLGNKFLIEMQSRTEKNFRKRILLYWSNVYSKSIRSGSSFKDLPKVYSFNFVSGSLFSDDPNYLNLFTVKNQSNKIRLTEDLEIYTIELGKFKKTVDEVETELDVWLLLIQKANLLKEKDMKTLAKKNPNTKKAIDKLKIISYNPRNEYHVIAKKMAAFDEANRREDRKDLEQKIREEGKLEGKLEGLEQGIEQGIERTIVKMVEKKISLDFISEVTGLSILDIIAIKKKHFKN